MIISNHDWLCIFFLFFLAHLISCFMVEWLRDFFRQVYFQFTRKSRQRKFSDDFECRADAYQARIDRSMRR